VFLVANIFSTIIDSRTGRGARVKAKPDPILAANQKGRILRRKERRRFLFVQGKETEKKNLAPRERTRKKKPETRTRNARLDRTIAKSARRIARFLSSERGKQRRQRARQRERDPALRVYIYFALTTCVNKKEEFGKIFAALFVSFFVFFARPSSRVWMGVGRFLSLLSLFSLSSLPSLSSLSISLSLVAMCDKRSTKTRKFLDDSSIQKKTFTFSERVTPRSPFGFFLSVFSDAPTTEKENRDEMTPTRGAT